MKVVVAIDSLKGSLSSLEAGDAIRAGILRADSSAEVLVRPLADGGEGTVEALTIGMGGTLQEVRVTGPLGTPVTAVYGILQDGKTAILEMAAAAGITLVDEKERNPLNTTTYGVGEMIRDAIAKGCRHFIVGIGGSATNDGGIGMLQALGYGLLDSEGKQVPFGAKGLQVLDRITDEKVIPELADCTFRVACDVTNTLCGDQGCSAVFGPQKGADPGMIMQMDKWLAYYATLAREKYEKANPRQAGTGAAGGLGFAFLTFTDAQLESGIKIVLEETRLEDYVKDADLVITGEGRLDGHGQGADRRRAYRKAVRKARHRLRGCGHPGCDRLQCTRHRCLFPDTAPYLDTSGGHGARECETEYDRYGRTGTAPVPAQIKTEVSHGLTIHDTRRTDRTGRRHSSDYQKGTAGLRSDSRRLNRRINRRWRSRGHGLHDGERRGLHDVLGAPHFDQRYSGGRAH